MESPAMLAPTISVVGSTPSVPFIHRYYVLLKGHYFLFFSAFGVIYPILNITLRARGLSDTEIAYTNLIIPFIVFFTNPLVGFATDRSRRYLLAFNIILVITTILYGLLFILPTIKTNPIRANMTYDDKLGRVLDFCASEDVGTKCSSRSTCGCSYKSVCQNKNLSFSFPFTMNSTDVRRNLHRSIGTSEPSTCGIDYRVPIDQRIQNYSSQLSSDAEIACNITCSIVHFCHGVRYPQQASYVLLYALLFIFGTNLLSNTITLGTSIGFASLPRPDLFGMQRVWGTVGFGVSALAASRLYGFFKSDYVYIIMFAIATGLCICITSFIHIRSDKQERKTSINDLSNNEEIILDYPAKDKNQKSLSQSGLPALIPLLKNVDVVVFLALTFIWGMSYAGLDPYVYLYIDEIEPCRSRNIIGWMSWVSASSEIVALFLAGYMLKWLGTSISSVLILIAFSIRFAGYYFIARPFFFLFVETMHYFNFGILYVLIAQKADAIAPPGLAGTLQGVVYGVLFGLGRGVGLIVSSFIYTRVQSRTLFLFFALFNAIAAIVFSVIFLVMHKRSPKETRANNHTNVPKIVIDPDTSINEEPLLVLLTTNNKVAGH